MTNQQEPFGPFGEFPRLHQTVHELAEAMLRAVYEINQDRPERAKEFLQKTLKKHGIVAMSERESK